MIRDMTLGQYYPAESVIHKMDPRVKLAGTFIYIIAIFCANNVLTYALVILALAAVIALSKVPLKFMLKGIKEILFILLFTVVLNLFLTPGTELWRFKFLKITQEGVILAVKMAVRLMLLIMGSSLMTLTTTPNHLTDGLEKALGPLKKVRVPVHEIAMMMSIALRFIPILLEETDKITSAQKARGADFETGNLMQRGKALIPVMIPLFVSSFRRAEELATAMTCRCYNGGEGRTRLKQLKAEKNDYIAMAITIVVAVISIWTNFIT